MGAFARVGFAALILAACSKVDYQLETPDAGALADAGTSPTTGDATITTDGGTATTTPEAAPPTCDLSKPFSTPVEVGLDEDFVGLTLTPDELTAYMQGDSSSDPTSFLTEVFVATRTSRTDPFNTPVPVTPLDAPTSAENNASLTPDGNTIYFSRDLYNPDGNYTTTNTFTSTRVNGTWAAPTQVSALDGHLFLGRNVLPSEHVYQGFEVQTGDLYDLQFLTKWGAAPTAISELNSPQADVSPALTYDELTIYFTSNRSGSDATDIDNNDIYVATRPSATSTFSTPTKVTELSTGDFEQTDWVSPDGCRLYFTRHVTEDGNHEFVAEKPPAH